MGVQDCPPLFLFKGLFHFLKPEGEERGENKRPLLLSLSVGVPSALLLYHTSLFSLFSLSIVSNCSLSPLYSLSIHLFSFFLSSLFPSYISVFSVSSPSYREVTQRSWLTKPIVLFQLRHCNCSPAAIYGHLCYSS